MTEHEMNECDKQTDILKANGYTTEEINNLDFSKRHEMIRNNCDGYEIGDFYNNYDEDY